MNIDLKQYMTNKKELIETAMRESWITPSKITPESLYQAMEYSLFSPGKRIRPILVYASAEALNMSVEDVTPIAAALEMIHVFSLIHDDLPAMDDDDLRRGKPTNHKVFGEAKAILAGDGLLSHAFVVLSDLDQAKYPAENIIKVIREFAIATGMPGMISGQVMDLEGEGKNLSLEALQKLHEHKTGALLRLAVTAPAIFKGADEKIIEQLTEYGRAIGLGFQIVDDILDIEGGKDLGKPIGSDVEKGKSTYPSLMGLEEAKKETNKMLDLAISTLSSLGPEAEPLRAIAKFIVERKT